MEWLLTVLIITTLEHTPIPLVTTERVSGIDKRERCILVGLYTASIMEKSDFRLPSETQPLIAKSVKREVTFTCDQVWSI